MGCLAEEEGGPGIPSWCLQPGPLVVAMRPSPVEAQALRELAVSARKLGVAAAVVFLSSFGPLVQALGCIGVLQLALVAHLHGRPFAEGSANLSLEKIEKARKSLGMDFDSEKEAALVNGGLFACLFYTLSYGHVGVSVVLVVLVYLFVPCLSYQLWV